MAMIKKKVNIFKNKFQKKKKKEQNKFSQEKVLNNQENCWYSQEKRKSKIRRNKKERKIRGKKELVEIKKNLPNQSAMNLTNIQLSQQEQSLLKKDPSFLPTISLTCVKILIGLLIS